MNKQKYPLMLWKRLFIGVFLMLIVGTGSNHAQARKKDHAELLRLHEQQKTAHLTYNAELFVEMFADNVTQLQRGSVVTRTKAENLKRFKTYFSGYKFLEWEDIIPPVIKISKDGTLATLMARGMGKDQG